MARKKKEPLFYLDRRTIHKRAITTKTVGGHKIKFGFPICTISEFVDAQELLNIFNKYFN